MVEAAALDAHGAPVEVCGFGLAAAGVGAMAAIARHAPKRIVLAGVAGTYDGDRAPVGAAVVPARVRCVGIGAGGSSAAELGFAATDEVSLAGDRGLALSVAAASGSAAEANARRGDHPGAVLEEMEGYSVALAATTMSAVCVMVRGISNLAGDRDRARWRMEAALAAVQTALDRILAP